MKYTLSWKTKNRKRNPLDPPLRAPFQENFVVQDMENQAEDEIFPLDTEPPVTFLTK